MFCLDNYFHLYENLPLEGEVKCHSDALVDHPRRSTIVLAVLVLVPSLPPYS